MMWDVYYLHLISKFLKKAKCLMFALHEVLENSDAEGVSQGAGWEQDDPRLHKQSFACQGHKVWEVNN